MPDRRHSSQDAALNASVGRHAKWIADWQQARPERRTPRSGVSTIVLYRQSLNPPPLVASTAYHARNHHDVVSEYIARRGIPTTDTDRCRPVDGRVAPGDLLSLTSLHILPT